MQKFFITHWFLLWPTIKPKQKVKKTKYPLFESNSSHWYCSQHLMYRYQVLTWWWRHILGNDEGHVTYSHNNSHEDRGDTARKSHPVSTYSTHNRCHLLQGFLHPRRLHISISLYGFGLCIEYLQTKSNKHVCTYNTCQTKLQYSTNLCCLMIFPGRHWRCLVCGNRSPWLPVQQGDLIHHCQTYCWAEMMFHYFRIPLGSDGTCSLACEQYWNSVCCLSHSTPLHNARISLLQSSLYNKIHSPLGCLMAEEGTLPGMLQAGPYIPAGLLCIPLLLYWVEALQDLRVSVVLYQAGGRLHLQNLCMV